MGLSKLVAGVTGAALLTGVTLVAAPGVALAKPVNGHGYDVPAQPYKGNPDKTDWMGSYLVDGKQVWCVEFAYKAPNSDEKYQPGDVLKDKWGNALPDDVAANISYLLLRYGGTQANGDSAALAHLLHTWTSGVPKGDPRLDPNKTFKEIGYDITGHLNSLPADAKAAVDKLRSDAEANRGPWTAKITPPTGPQVIGTPGKWTVQVTNAKGKGMGNVPVALTLADAKVGATQVSTPADGGPLVLDVTPTGANPSVSFSVDSPADRPVVQKPVDVNTQHVVSTGGEKKLTGSAKVPATTAPGQVKVTKTDATTNKGIAGVSLRVTAADKTAPAVKQDGSNLTGQDGKPLVLTTGADGTATVPDLRTPQDVCIIEVSAPAGYEQGFDPKSPPSVCGSVKPGEVLALSLTNKPNTPTVPVHIPAGDGPVVANAAVVTQIQPGALVGFGVLVLAGLSAIGLLWRRHVASGR
ncbi:hypothetical protein GCM10010174_23090 [Kutzneria viridogrisea]|uniref:SpaA-like prealbumin fold domain-containing protein n=1 Tax=Kutzneria viridogrisea TaxID=47990 RepID=A0ABR6BSM4_9PSEU|nr:hypothetical protein [Kutzneria viridogrisea]